MTKPRPLAVLVVAFCMAAGLVACGGKSGGPGSMLNVGLFGALSDAGLILAQQQGYFRDEGLNVRFVSSQSAPNIISLVAGGKLDAAGTSPTPGLFNAIYRGVGLKIAADKGQIDPTHSWTALVVRQDQFDSGRITSIARLRGKRIGYPDENTSTGAELAQALRSGGLSMDDVTLQPQSVADSFAALQAGSIDAAALQEPFVTLARNSKAGHVLAQFGDVLPNAENGILIYSEQMAKNKSLATRFRTAYLRGVAAYNAAFPGNGRAPAGRTEVVNALVAMTSVKNPPLYAKMAPVLLPEDGQVNTASIDYFQRYFQRIGSQRQFISSSRYLFNGAP